MLRNNKIFLLLPVLLLFVVCCVGLSCRAEEKSTEPTANIFQSIAPIVASQLISEKNNLVIVDVRTPEERELVAIDNSMLIPVRQVLQGKFSLSKNEPILIYCAVGGRSLYAAKYLIIRGYKEIYNLDGGIDAWQKAGLAVIKGEK